MLNSDFVKKELAEAITNKNQSVLNRVTSHYSSDDSIIEIDEDEFQIKEFPSQTNNTVRIVQINNDSSDDKVSDEPINTSHNNEAVLNENQIEQNDASQTASHETSEQTSDKLPKLLTKSAKKKKSNVLILKLNYEKEIGELKFKNKKLVRKNSHLASELKELNAKNQAELASLNEKLTSVENDNLNLKQELEQKRQRTTEFVKKETEDTIRRFNEILVKNRLDQKHADKLRREENLKTQKILDDLTKAKASVESQLADRNKMLKEQKELLKKLETEKSQLEDQIKNLNSGQSSISEFAKDQMNILANLYKSWENILNE